MIYMRHRTFRIQENNNLFMPALSQAEPTRKKEVSGNVCPTLPKHFNYNVIDAVVGIVIDELAEALSEGYVVELGELGHFSISLKCTHKVMTKREIRAESICFDNVHLRTSKEFQKKD